ncbi:MAG TPA: hypothetical protein VKV39_14535 [Candidatus Sulfotelmatobacter sp.]|nr:hypothetical protein [Candidatus Sulfotelmatobacter sp.]
MTKKRRMKGVVQRVIKPQPYSGEPEKAQIAVTEADDLYREIRVKNELVGDKGEKASLKQGAEVDVIVEADSSATLTKPTKA